MVKALLNGLMGKSIPVNGLTESSKAGGYGDQRRKIGMKESGLMVKHVEEVHMFGLMVISMKENLWIV